MQSHQYYNSRHQSSTQRDILLGLIFSSLFIYVSVGIFPIAPVEGDGVGIANGATQIAQSGLDNATLAYRYQVQSGTYVLTVLLHKLTGVDTFTVLTLLTALSSMLFIIVSAVFLSRVTAFPFATCGLVVLLFQEVFTSGYYGNSTVISALFAVTAFWIATFEIQFYRLLTIGLLLGLASWMRFDSILVAPVILLLLHRGDWKQTLARTALVAVIAVLVSLFTIYLSGSSIQAILTSASNHRASVNAIAATRSSNILLLENTDLKSHASLLTALVFVLIVLGIFHLLRNRDWLKLGIALLGTVPFYIIYLGTITTPKYLYYLIPFAALLVLCAFSELDSLFTKHSFLRKSLLFGLLILFIGQYIIGWQITSSARPYLRESFPNFVTLFSTHTPINAVEQISLVIGAGSSMTTADGRRLLSGVAFAPLFQRHQKGLISAEVQILGTYLANQSATDAQLNIVTSQYNSHQILLNLLLNSGYDCQRKDEAIEGNIDRFVCIKNGHQVNITSREISRLRPEQAERAINEMLAIAQASDIVFVSPNPQDQERFLKRAKVFRKINNMAYELDSVAPSTVP